MYRVMQKVFVKNGVVRTLITDFTLINWHIRSSCIKYKSKLPANYDVILITMWRIFTYDTKPKQTLWRNLKELSPEEKRVIINIFESGTSITEIGRLLKRPHSTVSTFIRRYLLRGELENRRRSGRPKKEYAPGLQKIRKTC